MTLSLQTQKTINLYSFIPNPQSTAPITNQYRNLKRYRFYEPKTPLNRLNDVFYHNNRKLEKERVREMRLYVDYSDEKSWGTFFFILLYIIKCEVIDSLSHIFFL